MPKTFSVGKQPSFADYVKESDRARRRSLTSSSAPYSFNRPTASSSSKTSAPVPPPPAESAQPKKKKSSKKSSSSTSKHKSSRAEHHHSSDSEARSPDRFSSPSSSSSSSSTSTSPRQASSNKKQRDSLEMSTELLRQLVQSARASMTAPSAGRLTPTGSPVRRGLLSDSEDEHFHSSAVNRSHSSQAQQQQQQQQHQQQSFSESQRRSSSGPLPPRPVASSMVLDNDLELPRADTVFDNAENFVRSVLYYVTEGLRDQRYTGLVLSQNKTFLANIRSIFVALQTERKRDRDRSTRLADELEHERVQARSMIERSLAHERQLEDQLTHAEQDRASLASERDRLSREVTDLRAKVDAMGSSGSQTEHVIVMLQDTQKALLQSNEYMLNEIQTMKVRHEREAAQWKRNYEELRALTNAPM